MKLATVNPRMDFNMEALLSKEVSWSNFHIESYVCKKPYELWDKIVVSPANFRSFNRGDHCHKPCTHWIPQL